MAYPHTIRLMGPWQCEPLARFVRSDQGTVVEETSALPAACRVALPCDGITVLGEAFRGRVRYTRRFGRPGNLDPHESVFLVIESVDAHGEVRLNGQRLGEIRGGETRGDAPTTEFDVTKSLHERNELVIELETPPDGDETGAAPETRGGQPSVGLTGEIRREIRDQG